MIDFENLFQNFIADTINWFLNSRSDKKSLLQQGLLEPEFYGDLV